MVQWYHQHNAHEFEQTVGDSEEQGSLASCSPWSCKESDTIGSVQQDCNLLSVQRHYV